MPRFFLQRPVKTFATHQSHWRSKFGWIALIALLWLLPACSSAAVQAPAASAAPPPSPAAIPSATPPAPTLSATLTPSAAPTTARVTIIPTAVVQPAAIVTLLPVSKKSNGPGKIVFSASLNDQGPAQLYIASENGSSVRPLIKSEFTDKSPRISPDGERVLFTRVSVVNGHEKAALYIVNIDGSGLKPVNPGGCQQPCRAEQNGAWSPDGKHIAFTKAIVLSESYEDQGIWIMNDDGSQPRQVSVPKPPQRYQDDFPAWSPDGSRIIFRRVDGMEYQSALLVIGVDGSGMKEIVSKKVDATEPAWSPDGTLIAFKSPVTSLEGREPNIYLIHADGSEMIAVTSFTSARDNESYNTSGAAWSPDGKQIIFSHSPSTDGRGDLFVVNRDGSGLKMLAATPLNESQVDWGTGSLP